VFDSLEQQLAPPLEALVRRGEFASFVAAGTRAEARARRSLDRQMGRYWHFWNLPTYTDIKQTAERLGALERRLRDLADSSHESRD
jgi:polyhydroxyalkanoate synthesis regulator phasin